MYQPSDNVLKKYAQVLLNYGLNSGKGVKKGEVVMITCPDSAKPMLKHLYRECLKSGAHPIIRYIPDGLSRDFFDLASDKQLDFYPKHYLEGLVNQCDHLVAIIAEADKHELVGVPPAKIMRKSKAMKPYMELREKKENAGKFSWTLAMYATPAMAKEAKLSLKAYWNEIIKACYLRDKDPVKTWRKIQKEINRIKSKLDKLQIESLHIKSKSTDLTIKLGKDRRWLGGTGANIPSFECYISPDWRGTEGYIQFTEPLYRYGNLITNAYLEFKKGKVVKATAKKGQKFLREMIKAKNADKVGEFSLTDKRFSKITKFMGETLFDENVGGKFGNTHVALGNAYKDSYPGNVSKVTKAKWKSMGYNESVVHTDIVSTENRVVTATLKDGSKKVIYKDGKFTI